jgi:hypothetical protein
MSIKHRWENWIIMERDKNNGAIAIACPMWYRHKMLTTFNWSLWRANYRHVKQSEHTILNIMKNKTQEWTVETMWNKKGSLSYAYGLPKEKDLEKLRPIIAYTNHPLKKLLNCTGRCISYMLQICKCDGLTLWKTQEVGQKLEIISKMTKEILYYEDLEVTMFVSDIKEMYTALPHTTIIEAVRWLIAKYSKKYGEYVSVLKSGRNGGTMEKKRSKKWWTIQLNQLDLIVRFILDNSIFKMGKLQLLQAIGIPMGSPSSPSLAILVCSYTEYQVQKTLGSDNRYIHGLRYMDDLWLAILAPKNHSRLLELRNKLYSQYNKHLRIEVMEKGHKTKFLDKTITWNGKFNQRHLSKTGIQ